MTPSPRPTLDQDLQGLQAALLNMGQQLDHATARAVQALTECDVTLAQQVIADDAQVNTLRYEVEEACYTTLATQAPAATDLRAVMAAFSIAADLERMADHAAGIATLAARLAAPPPLGACLDIPRMAEASRDMTRQALAAYLSRDVALARQVAQADDVVDALYQLVFSEALAAMLADPSTASRTLPVLFVAHNLERIGDRAVNIAERVVFITSGELREFKTGLP